MSHQARKKFPIAAPAILATLLMTVGAVSFSPAFADTPTFSGTATVLSISGLLTSVAFGATSLDSSGGWASAPMSEIQNNLASADMLTSSSLGLGQQAESQAATGDLVLLPGTPAEVDSDFAMSRAVATCDGAFGDAEI